MKKFFNWIDKTFVKPVEESKMPLGAFVLLAAAYILARNLFEGAFESMHLLGLSTITLLGVEEMFLHLMFSWMYLFMVIIVLLSFTTGHDIRKITRVLLTYSFIILIPPFVDFIFMPGGFRLAYPNDISVTFKILYVLARPWIIFDPRMVYEYSQNLPYGASPGMGIEIILGIILVFIYTWMRSPTTKRRIIALVLIPLVLFGTILLTGGAQVLMASFPGDAHLSKTVYFSGGLITSPTRKYALIVILPFIVVLFVGLLLYNKEKARMLIRSIDPFQAVLGAVAACAGFLFAWLGLKDVLTGVPRNPFDYIALLGLAVMGATSTSTRLFLSSTWDAAKPQDERKTFARAAGGMLILTVALAWCLGYSNLFILVVSLVFGLINAMPPLRLARWSVPSSLANSFAVLMLVYCGYSLFATERTFTVFPWWLSLAVFAPLLLLFLAREFILRRQVPHKAA